MNVKRVLLVVTLLSGFSGVARAQGLVGAPVDPRYGQSNAVDSSSSKVVTRGTQQPGTARMVLNAVIIALRFVRL
jgi:hypothetical protein